jgi:transcription elongation factor GreA
MADRIPITPEGFEALKAELQKLKSVDRLENIKDIEVALAHGDLSENAEYHAAKEKQGLIAGKIAQLEHNVAMAQVIDNSDQPGDKVRFGARVKLEDVDSGDEVEYRIVGEYEADAKAGKISVTSPVARAIMQKAPGEEVVVRVPKGEREFEIISVVYDRD